MANDRDPRTDLGAWLGDKLRAAREAAGYTSQDALARDLGFDRTTINKAETGASPPTADIAKAIAAKFPDLCNGLYPELTALARRAAGSGSIPGWFEDWLEAEGEAQSLLIWAPMVIPGLLQTPEYARALFLADQTDTSDEAIGALVAARLARQRIFDRAAPPDISVVLDEAVLHRMIGSAAIMHDALIHVAEASERPYIVVQVIPAGNGAHAGLSGAFEIASADGTADTVIMQGVEDQTTRKPSVVRKAAVTFNRLRGDALSRGQSRDLIRKIAEELWKTT
jgi:DNA-binding XRE family transcriptional regulator